MACVDKMTIQSVSKGSCSSCCFGIVFPGFHVHLEFTLRSSSCIGVFGFGYYKGSCWNGDTDTQLNRLEVTWVSQSFGTVKQHPPIRNSPYILVLIPRNPLQISPLNLSKTLEPCNRSGLAAGTS